MSTQRPSDEEIASLLNKTIWLLKEMPVSLCDLLEMEWEEYEESIEPIADWAERTATS